MYFTEISQRVRSEVSSNPRITTLFILFFILHLLLGVILPNCHRLDGSTYRSSPLFPTMQFLGGDFTANYIAAKVLRAGYDFYQNNVQFGMEFLDPYSRGSSRYAYPPLSAYLVSIISHLPFYTAYRIWCVFNVVLLLVSLWLLARLTESPVTASFFLLACYFYSFFFWLYLERGQSDIIPLFLLSLCFYVYRVSENKVLCAFFFSLAALFKVYPVIFGLFFLTKKRFDILLLSVIWAVVIILLSGWHWWVKFLVKLREFAIWRGISSWYINHSFSNLMEKFQISHLTFFNIAIFLAFMGSFLLALSWLLSQREGRSSVFLIELSAISLLMTLIPLSSYDYNLVALGFVYVSVFSFLEEAQKGNAQAAKYAWIKLILLVILIVDHVKFAGLNKFPVILGLKTLTIICIFGVDCLFLFNSLPDETKNSAIANFTRFFRFPGKRSGQKP